jgi:predicted TIM-barrel fold metal-dependent hydrolase
MSRYSWYSRGSQAFLHDRRRFLRVAAACLPAALPWSLSLAQPARRRPLIDVHHHWYNTELLHSWGRDTFDPNWTTPASLAGMDDGGVTTAMLSITLPGIWKSGDVGGSVKLARLCNEGMATTALDHPGRFGFFATLPLPEVDASLAEIAYALDVLKADGIGLLTSYDMASLGDPRFAPVFEEMNRRHAVLYIHPMAPNCCTNLVPGAGPGSLEAPTDTSRTVESLLLSGTLSRLTNLRVVLGAGGGTLPFVADRFVRAAIGVGKKAPETEQHLFTQAALESALARLHLDTAGVTLPPEWAALMQFTTPGQLLFGSDWPFASDKDCATQLNAMAERFGMSPADLEKIEHGNAQRLFPARLKAKV